MNVGARVSHIKTGVMGRIVSRLRDFSGREMATVLQDNGHRGQCPIRDLAPRCATCDSMIADGEPHSCPRPVGQVARHDANVARRRAADDDSTSVRAARSAP